LRLEPCSELIPSACCALLVPPGVLSVAFLRGQISVAPLFDPPTPTVLLPFPSRPRRCPQ
jgi:hypothetical protein